MAWFRENTGTLLRENFCLAKKDDGLCRTLLAATLFSRDIYANAKQSNILELLNEHQSELHGMTQNSQTFIEAWFKSYQHKLLRPTLNAFFRHGLVTEPHLQNILIQLNDV